MIDTVFFDELYKQFSWLNSVFTPVVESCSNEFFFDGFDYKLASVSTNMNVLSQNETFFVTKKVKAVFVPSVGFAPEIDFGEIRYTLFPFYIFKIFIPQFK